MEQTLNGEHRLDPIIGDPIVYARSPELLSASFARGRNAVCVPMEVPQGALEEVMRGPRDGAGTSTGMLVTMPHKHGSKPSARRLGDLAAPEIVSVIRRKPDRHGTATARTARPSSRRRSTMARPQGARVCLSAREARAAPSRFRCSRRGAGADRIRHRRGARAPLAICSPKWARGASGTDRRIRPGATWSATPRISAWPKAIRCRSARNCCTALFVGDVIAGHGTTSLIAAAEQAGCRTRTETKWLRRSKG